MIEVNFYTLLPVPKSLNSMSMSILSSALLKSLVLFWLAEIAYYSQYCITEFIILIYLIRINSHAKFKKIWITKI